MTNDRNEIRKELLIGKVFLEPSKMNVSFEGPDKDWTTFVSKHTVSLYLYDIRKNCKLHNYEYKVRRNRNRQAVHGG